MLNRPTRLIFAIFPLHCMVLRCIAFFLCFLSRLASLLLSGHLLKLKVEFEKTQCAMLHSKHPTAAFAILYCKYTYNHTFDEQTIILLLLLLLSTTMMIVEPNGRKERERTKGRQAPITSIPYSRNPCQKSKKKIKPKK